MVPASKTGVCQHKTGGECYDLHHIPREKLKKEQICLDFEVLIIYSMQRTGGRYDKG